VRRPLRTGSWRQAAITYSAVLPVSLVLNVVLAPITSPWPRLVVVIVNAAVLVASLNWALLPALHWITRDWAAPGSPHASGSPRRPRRRHYCA
jgi:antibiotic biosynthesis monooxygenase (ABM) superfamily enzyme